MEKAKQFLVVFSTAFVIFINYLAANSYIGGITPNYVSDKYPTFLTPAGYAFSIWGLIYLGLIIFSIYQLLPSQRERWGKLRFFYILSCLANCVWIYLWHHLQIGMSVGAMLVLLATLAAANMSLSKEDPLLARATFGLYFGWVTVATIVNITIWLVTFGIKPSEQLSIGIACGMIIIAALLGFILRIKLPNAAYPLAIAWGLTGIAVKYGGITSISLAAALAVVALLLSALSPLLKKESRLAI